MRHEPVIREATADDLAAFYGEAPKQSMRAYVAVLDGEPIAVAGVAYDVRAQSGRVKLFSEMKPEMRHHRKAIIRGARIMLENLGARGMVAVANPEEKHSRKLLSRLGFIPGAMTPQGQTFVYGGRR